MSTPQPCAPSRTPGAQHPRPRARRRRSCAASRGGPGFTLLELMFAVAIGAVLAVIAAGQYGAYIDRAKVEAAKADLLMVGMDIDRYRNNMGHYPASLATIGRGDMLDPWQRPYRYTDLTGPGNGGARRDKRLNPINTYFDLFSTGKDGVFKSQVDHRDSLDDVIRARDGAFVDIAEKF